MVQRLVYCTVLILALSGCAAAPSYTWVKPIYPSHKDVLTDDTKRQILNLNETLAKIPK